jgi:UDP-glucose 4-epimerase
MKYLLLGGAGFIGSHLAKNLIAHGHDVTIVDNLSTSVRPNFDVRFIKQDIRYLENLDSLIAMSDFVYFLAGSLGVEHIDKNPKATLDNNLGLMTVLVPLFEKHNKKVIFSSTSEVYGDGPFAEDNNLTIGPPSKLRWAYASAKLTTEFAIATGSFPYIIVRFFNVVGPGQLPDYGMVLPRFIRAAKNNEDLIVHSTGEQVRSFCHVADAVDALRELEKFNNEIFNLGNDEPVTINHLAERVIRLTDTQSKIKHVPYQEVFSKNHGDIIKRIPDLTKLKKFINFKPKYSLDDIIKDSL